MKPSPQRKKLAIISQPEYFRFTYENDLDGLYAVKEFKHTHNLSEETRQALFDYDADFNIFFRGEFFPSDFLRRLSGITINLSSEPFPRKINHHSEYTLDSLKRYLRFRKIRGKPFDYVFHYDAASLKFLKKGGLTLSGEFVFPVATDVYKPMKMDKRWDFFFIGRSTPHREHFFILLKQYYSFLHIAHGIWGESLVKYINAARICLNVHAEDEISWEPRLQMLLACGSFVISEPITPNEILRPGVDYIEVSSKKDMLDTARYFLEHEDERRKIAQNGYRRVTEQLNSRKVFTDLLEGIQENYYPKFKVASGSWFWRFLDFLWKKWHTRKKDNTALTEGVKR